jgi:hypothetical protein
MLACEWIAGRCMLRQPECGGLESVHGVTR